MRAILNGGYRRGAVVPRVDRKLKKVEQCDVYAPVALAGIGRCPTRSSRGRSSSRCGAASVPSPSRSSASGGPRRRRPVPGLDRDVDEAHSREKLETADPEIPDELGDRMQDCWEPLFAIADAAGETWPKLGPRPPPRSCPATRAARTSRSRSSSSPTSASIFDEHVVDRMASKALADRLAEIVDSEWADWYGKPITPPGRRASCGATRSRR